tara:strand:- start:912 stop:1151 length:240 start_codon:yes stop_codon:yes gene_type:complete
MNSFYVKGISRQGYGEGVLRLVQTQTGWTQRVVEGDKDFKACLNVDYVSKESEKELRSWLMCDMKKMNVLQEWFKNPNE